MKKILLPWLLAALLGGCAQLERFAPPMLTPKSIDKPQMPASSDTVGANTATPISDIETSSSFKDSFIVREMDDSDPLPDIKVASVSLGNATIYEALRAVLANNGVPFMIKPRIMPPQNQSTSSNATTGTTGSTTTQTNNTNTNTGNSNQVSVKDTRINAINLSGSLKKVMDILADSGDFFYDYKNGVVHVTPDRYFMVTLPPNDESMAGVSDTIYALGATYVYVNRDARTLVFIGSRNTFHKVSAYLEELRRTRSLIVYDTYIFDVELNDARSTGIQWDKFQLIAGKWVVGATQTPPPATDGMSLSTVYNSNRFNLSMLMNFLRTQGTLQTISQPKITLLTGTKSSIDVGETTNYVSNIGTTATNSATQTTVTTASILSGLKMTITGDIDAGTVFTKIDLSLSDLLGLQPFTALGTTLQLPHTANRDIATQVRCRPGDTIMLAGINASSDQSDSAGLPGANNSLIAPTHMNKSQSRSELVIVMRPRIIRFTDKEASK